MPGHGGATVRTAAEDEVMMTDTPTDIAQTARLLVERGWSPLPLPAGRKAPPPDGYTGYSGRYVTMADVDRWDWSGNLALRLPPDVVGIDVDAYHGGTIDGLEKLYGALPITVWSTSRDDGSGIALFRVPNGTTLQTNPDQGVDMIQAHHRYMVVAPSIHPEGRAYQWVDENTGETLDGPPDIDDLPELPWTWVEGLAVVKDGAANAATPDEVRAFVDRCADQRAPGRLKGVQTALDGYVGSRHDTLVTTACWALREAAAGWYEATAAIEVLHAWWRRVMDDPERRDGGEFGAVIRWSTAQVLADPERIEALRKEAAATPPAGVDPTTGEIIRDARNLPDEFWQARPVLAHVRQAAHSRSRCADSVLVAVLARVAVLIDPTMTLPAIVGSRASLNFFGAIVAASGEGKSSSKDVAVELVPITRTDIVDDISPGSGEGLVEMFLELVDETDDAGKKRKVKRQTKRGAFVFVDEGQSLLSLGERSGSTILPILRSAWSGAVLGQQNAAQETNRRLGAHRYRIGMVLGFQLAYAARLIADAEGGTPQRFVFANAADPTIPDDSPEWPGPIDFRPPPITGTQSLDVDADIATEVRRRALGVTRGEWTVDPLDAHADLVRLKVAALLALLDGRTNIDTGDWTLAGMVMRTSSAVRTWAIETARLSAQRSEMSLAQRLAERQVVVEDTAERRALESGARSLARRVHKADEPVARRVVMAAVASKHKALASIDDMLAYAESKGWITMKDDHWAPGESRPS